MKTIEYYQYMQWDGGDRHYPTEPRFFSKKDADAYLADNTYDYFDKMTLVIYESLEDFQKENNIKARASGLAKLTDEEKQALGLI